MLTKETITNRIEIDREGFIVVERVTRVLEDGVSINTSASQRTCYCPGAAELHVDAPDVSAVAALIWTPAVLSAFAEKVKPDKTVAVASAET